MLGQLKKQIPDVSFEQTINRNEPMRIISNDTLSQRIKNKILEDHVAQASDSQLSVLERASSKLRGIS